MSFSPISPCVKVKSMYSSCSEAEKKNSSIDPKISIHSIDSSAEVLLSPYKLVEINNRFIIKKHESIEQGMLCKSSNDIANKSINKSNRKRKIKIEQKHSFSQLNNDIEINDSSSRSSQDIKATPAKNSDVKIIINNKDISNIVSINFLNKKADLKSETEYANEALQASLVEQITESSKEISNFEFDFSILNVSIHKEFEETPGKIAEQIKIKDQLFQSSNEKLSISTGMFNSKSTNKFCNDSKETNISSKNLMFEFERIEENKKNPK